jgi:hypothetical protein
MASITTDPASGSITAVVTAVNISCDDADANTATGYDTDNYPASPAVNYVLQASATGEDSLTSEVFSTNSDGVHMWPSVLFPAAGTWTIDLIDTSDDSVAATTSVTVN